MLAVIPARKNSQGIPGKALRTVAGVPLILRTLRTVEESGIAERIVVSTDDPVVHAFCELRGFACIERPAELAKDSTPLLDVARHAANAESWSGLVAMFQPTCPLVQAETLRRVCKKWQSTGFDWAITAADDPHIYWRDGKPIG